LEAEEEQMDGAVEKSAMRKIYMRLLPFAILSYVLAYIDRINVSFAGLTMRADLDMSAAAFGRDRRLLLGLFHIRGAQQCDPGKSRG
jgi:sugar phosphate permease